VQFCNWLLTYPQEQKHRDVIMMCAALSATTNQVTWAYGSARNTAAIIDLLELLYNQFFSATKLYVTWDAVSWHKSVMLVDWLDTFNSNTRETNEGPLIELVPFPTSSQFLDVIEAVFSGMKRAVVHHSDYRNTSEMKTAISLHFAERNAHFRENPRGQESRSGRSNSSTTAKRFALGTIGNGSRTFIRGGFDVLAQ